MFFFFLFFFLLAGYAALFSENGEFQAGFYSQGAITTTKNNTGIRNHLLLGFPYALSYSSRYAIVHIRQILLIPYYSNENRELLYSTKKQEYEFLPGIYNYDASYIAAFYDSLFLMFGYSNPHLPVKKQDGEISCGSCEFSETLFPSLDFRIELPNHILTYSPVYWQELGQRYQNSYEETIIHMNSSYGNHRSLSLNQKNSKINYSFFYDYLHFRFGYYHYNQQNTSSNVKNFLDLDYYDASLAILMDSLKFRFRISQSKGQLSQGQSMYPVSGYRYEFSFHIKIYSFSILTKVAKSTGSRYDYLQKKWKSFGYTSIYNEYVPSPIMGTLYTLLPHYRICQDTVSYCDGLEMAHRELYLTKPSGTFYTKWKYRFRNLDFLAGTGFLEHKEKENVSLLLLNLPSGEAVWKEITAKKKTPKVNSSIQYAEPFFQIVATFEKMKVFFSYSLLYFRDSPQEKYSEVSRNFLLSFSFFF